MRRFLSGSVLHRPPLRSARRPANGGGAERWVAGAVDGGEYDEAAKRRLPSRKDAYTLMAAASVALPIDSTPWIVANVP